MYVLWFAFLSLVWPFFFETKEEESICRFTDHLKTCI